jgi:DNA repair exonuclease SbcCD ATPase subunit
MSTTTIEDQLTELRRRADRLQGLAAEIAESTRIQRHVHAVRRQEAAVLTAVRETPDVVDEKLGQLKTRLAVAERSLAADLSDDWATFAEAVEEELRSWDIHLERLQATAATLPWKARDRAEAAIGELRNHRLAVDRRLDAARAAALEVWHEQRMHVETARDELEREADELTATLN